MKRPSSKTLRKWLPINLVAVSVIALGALVPSHLQTAHGANYLALKSVIMHGGDADSIGATDPGRTEGPVQNAITDANAARAYPATDIPASGYPNGLNHYYLMSDQTFSQGWRELGPTYAPSANRFNPLTGAQGPVSGRATALAVDPRTCTANGCGTMYLGGANGGLYKTIDAGAHWMQMIDHQLSEAVGFITLDTSTSPATIWVGTGEPNGSADSNRGIGILRSSNDGATWTTLGYDQFVNRAITSIILDKANGYIYTATATAVTGGATTGGATVAGQPYKPAMGFFRSSDNGATWTAINPTSALVNAANPAGGTPGLHSLQLASDGALYAGYYTKGVYKSTDQGSTWTQQVTGLPASGFDRITLASAPSDSQTLYAAYNQPNRERAYKSIDGGATWSTLPMPDVCAVQCWYDMPLTVDTTNASIVYAGGQYNYSYESNPYGTGCKPNLPMPVSGCHSSLAKSIDGGQTWYDVENNGQNAPIHPDNHIITTPLSGLVYTGTDGGLFVSKDGTTNWTDLNKGLGTLQFTGIAIGPNGNIFGGTQDNGTFRYDGSTTWTHVNGGDGGPSAADPVNPNVAYYTYYGAQLFRDDNALQKPFTHENASTWIAPFWADFFVMGRGRFYEPYTLGAKNANGTNASNNLFYGTYRIWRSTTSGGYDGNGSGDATDSLSDTGYTWQPISPDLSGSVSAVAVSPVDPNYMIVGTSTGRLYRTTNALAPVVTSGNCDSRTVGGGPLLSCNFVSGVTWTRIDTNPVAGYATAGLPNRFPTSITFAPGSTSKVFVTYSGFNENTPGKPGHVFVTSDLGNTFTNIDGTNSTNNLPNLPFNSIQVNPNGHLYTAADFGVFISRDGGITWLRVDYGLPNVPVYQLLLNGGQLYATTHGRGVWNTGAS